MLLEMMVLVLHPTRKPLVCGKGSFLLAITNCVSELGVGTQSPGIWRVSAIPELSLSNFLLVQTQVRNCSVTFKRQVLTGRGGSEDGGAEVNPYQLQRRRLFVKKKIKKLCPVFQVC